MTNEELLAELGEIKDDLEKWRLYTVTTREQRNALFALGRDRGIQLTKMAKAAGLCRESVHHALKKQS